MSEPANHCWANSINALPCCKSPCTMASCTAATVAPGIARSHWAGTASIANTSAGWRTLSEAAKGWTME